MSQDRSLMTVLIVVCIAGIFGLLAAGGLAADAVMAQTQPDELPPVYGVEIIEYNDSLIQIAGTKKTYGLIVKNTGVMDLSEIYLGVDRLDNKWFSSDYKVSLKFRETGKLEFDLDVPENASGLHVFYLVVFGKSGNNAISNKVIISLGVLPSTRPQTTTTTPMVTTTLVPTTSVPTETTLPETTLPQITTTVTTNRTKILDGFSDFSERAFSTVKSTLISLGSMVKGLLTNGSLLLDIAGSLFIILAVLLIVREIVARY